MKEFLKKYSHIRYLVIFFIFYILSFLLLENRNVSHYVITDTWLDAYIPFNEYFVIPYLLWFVYIALGFAYFTFIDIKHFQRTCYYLFTGMIICLIIYLIIPNATQLKPDIQNDNLCQIIIGFIYSIDTPTNVCPSIHVYNSVMMMISLCKSKLFSQHKLLNIGSVVLAILICMSTVMIKQHAILDVIFAIILCVIVYVFGRWKWGY